ncbi:DEKNAAC104625 [Brettanomyces naardenensis]|uniref:DEKNAAC104625 n=1 Tax=Brettanomyces naardenensis TaxID=13370 RepID=A0A448YRS9_BRENA|nr:DEKNAAC104625 [Brettanomyces naardenensis]
MSFIFRRGLSTLIPPKIASAANIGSNPAAKRMQNIVAFYSKLPRGHAAAPAPKTAFGSYREKYRTSGAPLLHLILVLMVAGYSMDYYFEFSHEKE